jgi:hypothetical protein
MMQVAFYKGRLRDNPKARLFDRLICWWTSGPYSHCELVLGMGKTEPYALCGSSSIRDGGVRTKWITLDPARWVLIDVAKHPALYGLALDNGNHPNARNRARTWFEERLGAPYDWPAILGFVFHRRWGRGQKWFCSEAVCDSLGLPSAGISPNDLARQMGGAGDAGDTAP